MLYLLNLIIHNKRFQKPLRFCPRFWPMTCVMLTWFLAWKW